MKNLDKKNSLNIDDKSIILPKSDHNRVIIQKGQTIINNYYNSIVFDSSKRKYRAQYVGKFVGIDVPGLEDMLNKIFEELLKEELPEIEEKIKKECEEDRIKSEQELEERVHIFMNETVNGIMRDILEGKNAKFNIFVDSLRKEQENIEKKQSEMEKKFNEQQAASTRVEEELRKQQKENRRIQEELIRKQEELKKSHDIESQKLRDEMERRFSDYDEKSKQSKPEEQKAVQNIAEVKPVKPSTSKKVYNKNGGKLHPLTLKYLKKKTLKVNIPLLILGILFTIVGGVLLFQYGKPGFAMMWNAGIDLFAISLLAMLIERFTRGYYNKYKTLIRVTIFFAVYILCLIWCSAFLMLALHEMLIIELPGELIIAFSFLLGFGSLGFMFCDFQFCRHTSIKRWLTDFI